ncbi:hypothetical protein HDV00_005319 [Rhizophlyctis rosea]|nr:hypothetical protein HDV00_005319 [Rhizophlyctis rosea]
MKWAVEHWHRKVLKAYVWDVTLLEVQTTVAKAAANNDEELLNILMEVGNIIENNTYRYEEEDSQGIVIFSCTMKIFMEALDAAADNGHVKIVKKLVDMEKYGVNLGAYYASWTLQATASRGFPEIVNFLLKTKRYDDECLLAAFGNAVRGGNNEVKTMVWDAVRETAAPLDDMVVLAAMYGDLVYVRKVLDAGVDVNAHDGEGLIRAAREGHREVVNVLLKAGGNLNFGKALRLAAIAGYVDIVGALLKAGANVDEGDSEAIWSAASRGHTDVVEVLLTAGANPKARHSRLLLAAVASRDPNMVKFVLDAGADVHIWSNQAVYMTAGHCNHKALAMLLAHGADANGNNGRSLFRAVTRGYIEVVKLLLNAGVNVHSRSDRALFLAAKWGHTELVRYLVKAGADVHSRNDEALWLAAYRGNTQMVRILLEAGANVHAGKDRAFWAATAKGHVEVVQMLLRKGWVVRSEQNDRGSEDGVIDDRESWQSDSEEGGEVADSGKNDHEVEGEANGREENQESDGWAERAANVNGEGGEGPFFWEQADVDEEDVDEDDMESDREKKTVVN